MVIEKIHIEMIQAKGFDAVYDRELPKFERGEDCFNKLNDEYKRVFGAYRYASYESYRVARSNRR